MIYPAKFNAVNYPLSTILLILAGIYLYFLSPFSGIVFFPVFFLILAVISFTHPYALIITENEVIYKPFPVFSKRTIEIVQITGVSVEAGRVNLLTNKNAISVRKYFLKKNQWSTIVSVLEQLSKASDKS